MSAIDVIKKRQIYDETKTCDKNKQIVIKINELL
jgi:hypothetical protein